jgi:transposase InsO family protein
MSGAGSATGGCLSCCGGKASRPASTASTGLYREEWLAVRKRRARRKACGVRVPILVEARPNARWSLDFVSDQFAGGRRFRILNIVDDVTKECLGAIADTSVSGRRVARELTSIVSKRGKPGSIVWDNGTEFTCNAMLAWCKDNAVDWHFIAPGKPIQNAFVEMLQRSHARRVLERDAVLRPRRRKAQARFLGRPITTASGRTPR